MVDWVQEADPDAVLYLNDYDILTGRRLDDYMAHIRGFWIKGWHLRASVYKGICMGTVLIRRPCTGR
jgi:hypothetical protein